MLEYVERARPAPRPTTTAGVPKTAEMRSSVTWRSSRSTICWGLKLRTETLVRDVITRGSPRRSPPKRCAKSALISAASSCVTSASSPGESTTPGTPRFRSRLAVQLAAALSVAISRNSAARGDSPLRVFSGSIPSRKWTTSSGRRRYSRPPTRYS